MVVTKITLQHQTESDLFDNADPGVLETIDIPASIAKFEKAWQEQVDSVYATGKPVVFAEQFCDASVDYDVPATADDLERETLRQLAADIEYAIQLIAEALFDEGNLWMVEKA